MAAKTLGMEGMSAEVAECTFAIGRYIEQGGAIAFGLGQILSARQKLEFWLKKCATFEKNTDDAQLKLNAISVASGLLSRQIQNQSTYIALLKLRGSYSPKAQTKQRSRSFSPGAPVAPANQVNLQVNIEKSEGQKVELKGS